MMSHMSPSSTEHGSLWELAVLALLREEPMHPYQMQRILRERHEDEVLGLKRGSLYHAIRRLVRTGLIEPVTTGREGRRPERTTYRLTPNGAREFVRWLRQRLATPQSEPSEFMGSISFLVHLAPKDAARHLELRARALEGQIDALGRTLQQVGTFVPRIHLIERHYLQAIHKAEREWVRGLVGELRSGRFAWDLKAILREVRAARRKPASKEER
jgi:DNA-binding PadR family transcriptional regulator